MSCVAPGCRTGYGDGSKIPPGISVHIFPKNPVRRAEWVNAVPRPFWKPSKSSVICSKHFLESDYRTERPNSNPSRNRALGGYKYKKLKHDAVPSLFPELAIYLENQKLKKGHTSYRTEFDKKMAAKQKELELLRSNSSENCQGDLLQGSLKREPPTEDGAPCKEETPFVAIKIEPDWCFEDQTQCDSQKLQLSSSPSDKQKKTKSDPEGVKIKAEPYDTDESTDKLEPDKDRTFVFHHFLHRCQHCQMSFEDISQFTKHCQEKHSS